MNNIYKDFSLSYDSSSFNINEIINTKYSSLISEKKDNYSSFEEKYDKKLESNYKDFNLFEKEYNEDLNDYYENFYK